MAEFLYDAQVTADDLNNIAVDLGGALTTKFTNDYPYAVDSLNAITGDLVSSGITSYGEKFSVTKDGENIVIGTGLAIFDGGLKYKLTTPLTMPIAAGDLFIELNAELNTVTMKLGTLPVSGIYNHIATIAEDGAITDKRVWAKAKVLLPSEGCSYGVHYTEVLVKEGSPWSTSLEIAGATEVFIMIPNPGASDASFYKFNISSQTFTGVFGGSVGGVMSGTSSIDSESVRLSIGTNYRGSKMTGSVSENVVTFEIKANESTDTFPDVYFYAFGGETV